MTLNHESHLVLLQQKMQTVRELTELNSQHIRTQSRLSGIEIETAKCEEACSKGESTNELNVEKRRLEREYEEIMQSRVHIDTQRHALELRLRDIDNQLTEPAQDSD